MFAIIGALIIWMLTWFSDGKPDDQTEGKPEDKTEQQTTATDGDPAGQQGGDTQPSDTQSEEKLQFTQSAYDHHLATRARQAKSARETEILEALGVDSMDTLKEVFDAHKAAQEAKKTDLEKAQEQIAVLQTSAAEDKTAHDQLLIRNAVMVQAPTHEIPPDRLDALLTLMDTTSLTVKDGTVEGVEAAIKATIEANPFLILAEKQDKKGTPHTARQTKTQRVPDATEDKSKGWRGRKASL